MGSTEDLIRSLASEATPVGRLRHPLARAAAWIALATLVVALLAYYHGLRPDLAAKLRDPAFLVQLAAAWATGAAATLAAFEICLPDRSRAWLLLPLPGLALWLSGIGYGCLAHWIALPSNGPMLAESLRCFETVVLTSLPLSLLLLVMLRRARPLRAATTAWAAGLAVAGFAAVALSLLHAIDVAILVLAWNLGTVLGVAALGRIIGGRALDRPAAAR